jgi:ureidoglycolate lyase
MRGARLIRPEPLRREAFAAFGEVIQKEGAKSYKINGGSTLRIHDLCKVQTKSRGRPLLSFFEALELAALPYPLRLLECHPLGSQAFIPCGVGRFLIAVAPPANEPQIAQIRAFVTDGRQGVNYAPGAWHLPLASFDRATYVVVDRGGPGVNLREHDLSSERLVIGE